MTTADTFKGAKRLEGETWEDYKARRARENALTRKILRGKVVWDPRREGKAYTRPVDESGKPS